MKIEYKHTPAGTIMSIGEWNTENDEMIWTYYHLLENVLNGPFINFYFVGKKIEFEVRENIFVEFNKQEKKWTHRKYEDSIIIKEEKIDLQNDQLKTWYGLYTLPALA